MLEWSPRSVVSEGISSRDAIRSLARNMRASDVLSIRSIRRSPRWPNLSCVRTRPAPKYGG